jgi:hypothetical protein
MEYRIPNFVIYKYEFPIYTRAIMTFMPNTNIPYILKSRGG